MLSRRALVGKLAAGAAVTVAWAAGAARQSAAATRSAANTPIGSGLGADRPAPEREAIAALPPAPEANAVAPALAVRAPVTGSAPAPWALLRPLRIGSVVARGWRVAELSEVVDGACVLTLRHARGRTYRVHLCRNDGRPQGLVYTERLDLVVMNGGQGDLPTDEGLAQAVAQVAHVLAANETGRQHNGVVVALLPQAERMRRFTGSADARLR